MFEDRKFLLRFVFLAVVVGLVVVVFSDTVMLFLVFLMKLAGKEVENDYDITREYQTYQWNPSTGESSIGMVTMFENIEDGESVFYESGGEYVLISNFGSTEYKCSGVCHCENDERRTSIPMVRKGLSYLLVAASSVIAYNLADEYFKEECHYHLSESCDDDIKANVEECSEVKEHASDEEEDKMYMCKGRCMTRMALLEHVIDIGEDEAYVMGEMKNMISQICNEIKIKGEAFGKTMEEAVLSFQDDVMGNLCEQLDRTLAVSSLMEQEGMTRDRSKSIALSYDADETCRCTSANPGESNPTIKCVEAPE